MNNPVNSSKEKKPNIIKRNIKDIVIGLLLVSSIVTNAYLIGTVVRLQALTMQFMSDVFYYTPDEGVVLPEEGDITETVDTDVSHDR